MDSPWETTTCRELCQMCQMCQLCQLCQIYISIVRRRRFGIPMHQELVAKYLDTCYRNFTINVN